MKKRLLNKFVWVCGWLWVGLLATVQVVAGVQPTLDSCQHPEPPVIVGSANAICRSEPVVLTATGCAGTTVWSTGEMGDRITIRPQQTTTYTAICRARQGCISCFANGWKIIVNTPGAPTVTPSATLVCAGDAVTLTANDCAGTIHWSVQGEGTSITGSSWTDRPQQTSVYQATCQQNSCTSNPSAAARIQLGTPTTPVVAADKRELCAGQAVRLTVSNCLGTVRWSDGGNGFVRTLLPNHPVTYRAICQIGSCRSDSSEKVLVAVRPAAQLQTGATTLTNGCPFQTADLSKIIPVDESASSQMYQYLFRTEARPDAPAVQSPGAVTAGTYYVFGRDEEGCHTEPVVVVVNISPCKNAVPVCLSNPPALVTRLNTLDWATGVVQLRGQLSGSATEASWGSSGDGLFTDSGLNARYLLSEAERQRGSATFTLTTPDPDGSGPCVGALSRIVVAAPARLPGVVGLSKKAGDPAWVTEGANRLIELTYQLGVANLGQNTLTNVRVFDDLDRTFSAAGVRTRSVSVRADSGLVINPLYTGRGSDTTLVLDGKLPIAGQSRIWLTVRLDVSQATTLTFLNQATVEALDGDGLRQRDRSTEGTEADPDRNGTPADNAEPTRVTLQSLQPDASETVFIPEGFSPNNDGINDRFVIQRLPTGITVQLEIFNRWGHAVYQNSDYKNDWDGTANQGIGGGGANRTLPDGTYYYQVRLSDGRDFARFLTLVR